MMVKKEYYCNKCESIISKDCKHCSYCRIEHPENIILLENKDTGGE